jgi:hypothetical protein
MNAAVKIDCSSEDFFKMYVIVTPGGNTPVKGCKKPTFTVKGCKWYLLKHKVSSMINWCAIPDMTARALRKEISTAHSLNVETTVFVCKGSAGGSTRRNKSKKSNKKHGRTRRN